MIGAKAKLLAQIERMPRASEQAIEDMVARLGIEPSKDYIDFLSISNGGTGIGPDLFVTLLRAEDVAGPDFSCDDLVPGLIIIGGDGLGNDLGIDARTGQPLSQDFVVFDPVWLDLDSVSVQYRGKTFWGTLEYLAGRFDDNQLP